jgi:hypothetical protein
MAGLEATLNDRELRTAINATTLPDTVLTTPVYYPEAKSVSEDEDADSTDPINFPESLIALVKTIYPFADNNDLAKYLKPDYPQITYGQRVKAVLNGHTRIEEVDRNLCYDIDHRVPTFLPESLKGKSSINALVDCNRLYFTDKAGQEDEYYNPELISGTVLILYVATYFSQQPNPVLERMGHAILQKRSYRTALGKIKPELEEVFGPNCTDTAGSN